MNQMKWVYYAKITFENFCTSFGIFVPDVTHTVLQSLWLSSSTAFMQKNVFTSLIILQTMHLFFFQLKILITHLIAVMIFKNGTFRNHKLIFNQHKHFKHKKVCKHFLDIVSQQFLALISGTSFDPFFAIWKQKLLTHADSNRKIKSSANYFTCLVEFP